MHKSELRTLCTLILILLYFLQIQIEICEASQMDTMVKKVCAGKVGECSDVGMEKEMLMNSESNRRVLWMQKRYISYDTLKRDLVPCDRRGASYYNCKIPGVANSYNRGCEVITRCARGG